MPSNCTAWMSRGARTIGMGGHGSAGATKKAMTCRRRARGPRMIPRDAPQGRARQPCPRPAPARRPRHAVPARHSCTAASREEGAGEFKNGLKRRAHPAGGMWKSGRKAALSAVGLYSKAGSPACRFAKAGIGADGMCRHPFETGVGGRPTTRKHIEGIAPRGAPGGRHAAGKPACGPARRQGAWKTPLPPPSESRSRRAQRTMAEGGDGSV